MLHKWIDRVGDWNPQLFRELKGRVTPKSLSLMALVSGIVQSMVYFTFSSALPHPSPSGYFNNYYCIGNCVVNGAGDVTNINWPLWWANMFVTLSIMGFFAVLLGGTYLLIQDLSKEQRQGTLNFVTLTPQSAMAIALGKIMGVPIFVYGMVAFAVPLHLLASIQSGMSFPLVLAFYGVLAACFFFTFNCALLYSLVSKAGTALKAWMATGALFYFSTMSTVFIIQEGINLGNTMDGALLLNPLHLLHYLIRSTAVADQVDLFRYVTISEVSFYGVFLWGSTIGAILAHLVVYGVGSYWVTRAFKRKFHNAQGTLISKKQSYFLTLSLVLYGLGFTVQEPWADFSDYDGWLFNFTLLSVCGVVYTMMLVVILSPPFQSMQDWSRYRGPGINEWVFGERSPAFWAIAINLTIGILPLVIAGFVLVDFPEQFAFALGLVMQGVITMLVASIGLSILLNRHKKRTVIAASVIMVTLVMPFIILGLGSANPELYASLWLWTMTPLVATQYATIPTIFATMLAQVGLIVLMHRVMKRRINRIGGSELKKILEPSVS